MNEPTLETLKEELHKAFQAVNAASETAKQMGPDYQDYFYGINRTWHELYKLSQRLSLHK